MYLIQSTSKEEERKEERIRHNNMGRRRNQVHVTSSAVHCDMVLDRMRSVPVWALFGREGPAAHQTSHEYHPTGAAEGHLPAPLGDQPGIDWVEDEAA